MRSWLVLIFALIAALQDTAFARPELLESCADCHSPQGQCQACHEQLASGLYKNAPVLTNLSKYEPSGLLKFLKAPQKRYPFKAAASMHPLSHLEIAQLNLNTPTPTKLPGKESSGEALFKSLGCGSCHPSQAPKLRLGYPFLTLDFFSSKIRGELTETLDHRYPSPMPTFPQLSPEQTADLYSYISTAPPENETHRTLKSPHSGFVSGPRLYKKVMNIFKKSGCVHCHGGGKLTTFGLMEPSRFQLHLIDEELHLTQDSDQTRQVVCADQNRKSILVDRLQARLEEYNHQNHQTQRGMPLGLAPLDHNEIATVKSWVLQGSPLAQGNRLCEGS